MSVYDIDYNHDLPPLNAVMPYTPQLWVTIIFVGLSAAFLLYGIYLSIKWKNWLPVLFWFGGLTACVVEPIADANLHALHAPIGQWNAFTSQGHPIPWHIFLAYPFYYGGTLIAIWPVIARRTMTRSFAWKLFIIGAVWCTLLEQLPLAYGVWIYYGMQPFRIGHMSIAMIVPNMASIVMAVLIMYKLAPSINTGWKRLIAVPAVGMASLGAHTASGALMYLVMGMDLEKIGQTNLNILGFISIVLGFVCVWMTMELTEDKSDTSKALCPEPKAREVSAPLASAAE